MNSVDSYSNNDSFNSNYDIKDTSGKAATTTFVCRLHKMTWESGALQDGAYKTP